jgi:hypothetical protein
MRLKEILVEKKTLTKNQRDSIPHTTRTGVAGDPNGPTNFYHKYRLGVAMAGSPDFDQDITSDGPVRDDMVVVHITDADKEISDRAHKKLGYKQQKVTTGKSRESSVNNVSPVATGKRNRFGV